MYILSGSKKSQKKRQKEGDDKQYKFYECKKSMRQIKIF